jgi:hypothetical protein
MRIMLGSNVTFFVQSFAGGGGTGVRDARGGVVWRAGRRALLWVSAVRPCRSIADWRTNIEKARITARWGFSVS